MTHVTTRYDAIIGGAGPTGLAMALALSHVFNGDVSIAIVDPAATDANNNVGDPRAWALSAASSNLLDQLRIWPEIVDACQPVNEIAITDTALDAGLRPVLLTYDNALDDGQPAAHIVPNQVLLQALWRHTDRAIEAGTIVPYRERRIIGINTDRAGRAVQLDDGNTINADLVIAADGRGSALREMTTIPTVQWRYEQHGIVVTVEHERCHHGRAVQHFLPGGPFAILPLPGNQSCITWSEATETAQSVLAIKDDLFARELQRRFGGQLGVVRPLGQPQSFPLSLSLARRLIDNQFALIGDAAHAVHPIAGQGLNLAFRDVAALTDCVHASVTCGLPFGDATALERYQAWRRFDSMISASAFDAINRLFSNDVTLLRSMREIGLGIVDRTPTLKRMLVEQAAGLAGTVPTLLNRSSQSSPSP